MGTNDKKIFGPREEVETIDADGHGHYGNGLYSRCGL